MIRFIPIIHITFISIRTGIIILGHTGVVIRTGHIRTTGELTPIAMIRTTMLHRSGRKANGDVVLKRERLHHDMHPKDIS